MKWKNRIDSMYFFHDISRLHYPLSIVPCVSQWKRMRIYPNIQIHCQTYQIQFIYSTFSASVSECLEPLVTMELSKVNGNRVKHTLIMSQSEQQWGDVFYSTNVKLECLIEFLNAHAYFYDLRATSNWFDDTYCRKLGKWP